MWQLISHIFFFIFFYRSYKYYFGDWTGWYVFLIAWHFFFFLIGSLFSTDFWFKQLREENYMLLYMYIISILISLIFLLSCMLISTKFRGRRSEYWWSVQYGYYRFFLLLNWQKKLFIKNSQKINYYNNWYRYQFNRYLFDVKWIFMSLVIYIIFIQIYIQIFFRMIFRQYYCSYWLNFIWIINNITIAELFACINMYILLKFICLNLILYWSTVNVGIYEIGTITKNMFEFYNIYLSYKTDFKYWFCYEKSYKKNLHDYYFYEFSVNWWNWHQMIVDSYYIEQVYVLIFLIRYIKFRIYWKIKLMIKYSRQVAMFSYGYNHLWIEQEIQYR